MEGHISREENVLFPEIVSGQSESKPAFGSLRNPIAMLEEDHNHGDQLLGDMRAAARGYQLPEASSESLYVLFRELRALEASIHAHTSLERSILFSRALQVEHDTAATTS